ncbi:MAG TPA: dephospho-CoA kinase [Candidatus Acidoferrales bacterium]|nr:dephospho-CoA kinase [Candidatus Acidoferrales bacterium]
MKLIGLTGGIATGKSAVAAVLRELGATVLDADQIAREIVEPQQEAWREIVRAFGRGVLRPDGKLDREKLRRIVFADTAARKRLESITHPHIRARVHEKIKELADQGARVVVYEAPLLFENGVHHWLRPVLLVACAPEIQRARLARRDRLTPAEVERHLAAQMPLDEKRKLADFVIENNGDLAELRKKVVALWPALVAT